MNRWRQVNPLMLDQGEKVLRTLLDHGYRAFFVGGCVRDELMGRPVHDMDIATSAKPDDVTLLFERTVPTGIRHGTVTVLIGKFAFEVTTFRKESQYEDHRRPAAVEFVDAVTEDLQRRDFTMNAIARDIEGELTDPFQGQADIERGLIRCVGIAEERFGEDALRMMRAIRFASVFGFRPVKSLWKALLDGKDKLSYIAMERIRTELEKIVLGPDPLRGLALVERSGLLRHVKAVQGPQGGSWPAWPDAAGEPDAPLMQRLLQSEPRRDLLAALPLLPADPPGMRWSLLLQGLGATGEAASRLLKSWTFPNQAAWEAAGIVRFDEAWEAALAGAQSEPLLRRDWIRLELAFGRPIAALWLCRQPVLLQTAVIGAAQWKAEQALLKLAAGWHTEVRIHTLSELAVSGGEVLRMTGRKGGPWLGELMKELLLTVAAGELPNEQPAILDHVKAVVKETWTQTD